TAGDRRRGRGALPSPRVGRMSRRATGGPRWMAIPACRKAGQDRTRLTDRLADAHFIGPWARSAQGGGEDVSERTPQLRERAPGADNAGIALQGADVSLRR